MNYGSRRDVRDRPAQTADTSVKTCDLTLTSSYTAPTPLLSKEKRRECWETILKQDFWHLRKVPWVNMLLCSLFHFLSTVCFLFLCLWF